MHKPKVAVVGCGYWGKNLVRNFSQLEVLDCICDAQMNHAEQLAQNYNVAVKTFDEILNDKGVTGVVIAAPAEQHYALTKQVLIANKHVFVEKPLSLKVTDAQELCDLAKQQNKVLMVGHLLQYHPAFLKLKEIVYAGKLGKLQYIYSNRLNLGKFRSEENILWSFAPHDISMILSLANDMPETVYATGCAHLNKHIHDVTTTHLKFKDGVNAHIFVSWLHPFKEQKLVVVGDKGMIVFDDGLSWHEKMKLYPHQVTWINGAPQPQKADYELISLEQQEPLAAECQHFLDCIVNNKEARTDGDEGLKVLQVLDAAQTSLKINTAVNLTCEDKIGIDYYAHQSSYVDAGCNIGAGTKIWHYSHILPGTKIGKNCIIGQNVMLGPDVIVGDNCKIQNNVSLYKGVILEQGVFCGPSCVFTNVHNPRAEVERKDEFRETYVEAGVTIGANATIICGNRLGAYSLIGAGAVVTKDVKPHAVMAGNPAKQIGWVSHAGEVLGENLQCLREGKQYLVDEAGNLKEIVKQERHVVNQA
jgi:predicted dehydrogenase/acetyltransferase-like isoleucine patch superfamily enzyme